VSSLSSDKMRDMPIGKLILTMSLPAMLSMLVKALYNIVDSIYISHYSLAGLNALSIVFPLQTIVIAMSIAIGVGTNAMVARKLGERNREEANFLAGNGLFLTICGFLFVLVLGLVFPRTFLGWFTNDIEVINAGVDYLTIILCFSFGVFC
jgi:Na+-driven multidrug efflux pump